jgi:hypothetical protein
VRHESGAVIRRICTTALGVGGLLLVGAAGGWTDEFTPRWILLGLLALFLGFAAFYATSLWYINRHWFGLSEAHPLLGPLVAGLTVCLITALELLANGPGALPLRTWFLITFCGLTTTLGLCLWEGLAFARGGTSGWPATIAAVVTAAVLVPGVLLVTDGTVERWLCDGGQPRVDCTVVPHRPAVAAPAAFDLRTGSGVDVNTTPPAVPHDPRYADLVLEPHPGGTRLRTDGRHALSVWPFAAGPDRDSCAGLFDSGRIDWTVVPAPGTVLCLETTGGELAAVRIRASGPDGMSATVTVWF